MGTQFKAYNHYILQTRYNERFTPVPTSKREYKPAEFIKTLIPMQPEGSQQSLPEDGSLSALRIV